MFLPVLTYVYPEGISVSFDVIDFVNPPDELVEILSSYSGPFYLAVDRIWSTVLAFLAIASIVVAFVGVITISMQRPNTWQLIMTVAGLVGTAIPSILIFLAVCLSTVYFSGTFQFGVYPLVTPIAMALCIITVIKQYRRTRKRQKAQEAVKHLIRPAGDL
jgi:ABC-type dipeptide/oligopeptide/nickel transport system permease component